MRNNAGQSGRSMPGFLMVGAFVLMILLAWQLAKYLQLI
jgi:hypothetical protein